jgi:hypothetical protein
MHSGVRFRRRGTYTLHLASYTLNPTIYTIQEREEWEGQYVMKRDDSDHWKQQGRHRWRVDEADTAIRQLRSHHSKGSPSPSWSSEGNWRESTHEDGQGQHDYRRLYHHGSREARSGSGGSRLETQHDAVNDVVHETSVNDVVHERHGARRGENGAGL